MDFELSQLPIHTRTVMDYLLDNLATNFSFSSPYSDFVAGVTTTPMNELVNQKFPRNLLAALQPSMQARVITESVAPFRITHVNEAWEGEYNTVIAISFTYTYMSFL